MIILKSFADDTVPIMDIETGRTTRQPREPGADQNIDQKVEAQKIEIVYRANPLFDEYVPHISAALQRFGYSVAITAFPEGTPEEKIKTDTSKASRVLADETFCRVSGQKHSLTLDQLLEAATRRALDGLGQNNADSVKKLVDALNACGNPLPEIVYVDADRMAEHLPGYRVEGQNSEEDRLKAGQAAARDVAEWFRQALPREVRVYDKYPEEALNDNFDEIRGHSWIVADRHAGAEKGWGLVFLIPLASSIHELSKAGKIAPKTEEIANAIPAIVEEMLVKEEAKTPPGR